MGKMAVNRNVLDNFQKVTKYDIVSYYKKIYNFLKNDYTVINDYFSGYLKNIDQIYFDNLRSLKDETQKIITIFSLNGDKFNNYEYWELIYNIESIQSTLLTVTNLSKWLRSSITNLNINKNAEVDIVLQQGTSLEDFNKKVLNSNNEHNEWFDTAVRNDLNEEDYTYEGGNLLKTSFTQFGKINIKTIVDNISGDKVYGLDLDLKIQFENDDLKVLNYKDTFIQTILILSRLKQNDNPFYPDQGINKNFVIGSNINLVAYPSIFRQMSETFSKDDTIKSFAITDIRRVSDGIFLDFEVESQISQNSAFTIQINN